MRPPWTDVEFLGGVDEKLSYGGLSSDAQPEAQDICQAKEYLRNCNINIIQPSKSNQQRAIDNIDIREITKRNSCNDNRDICRQRQFRNESRDMDTLIMAPRVLRLPSHGLNIKRE